jgi:hypothetical protein
MSSTSHELAIRPDVWKNTGYAKTSVRAAENVLKSYLLVDDLHINKCKMIITRIRVRMSAEKAVFTRQPAAMLERQLWANSLETRGIEKDSSSDKFCGSNRLTSRSFMVYSV